MTVSLTPLHHSVFALVLATPIALSVSLTARAQGSEGMQPPALESTVEAGQPIQTPPAAAPAEPASPPATDPVEAVQSLAAPDADAPSAPDTDGDAQPKAAGTLSATPETPAVPELAPSLLEDPAGALSQMLEPVERDPNLPHDLSPWGMFMAADWVVKGVMIGLAFASLLTWTIWLAKSVEIACAKARARRALTIIGDTTSISDAARRLAGRGGPAVFMVRMAESEMDRSEDVLDHAGNQGILSRALSHLLRIEAQAGRRLSRGTGVLATIGSTAPFVGLFGTVWGIMNAFIGISEAQTTNLAVVAPGIAEALLATALGLVAAIPAVVIYNIFARSVAGYKQLLADASAAVERLVSLDLDRRKVPDRAGPSSLAAE